MTKSNNTYSNVKSEGQSVSEVPSTDLFDSRPPASERYFTMRESTNNYGKEYVEIWQEDIGSYTIHMSAKKLKENLEELLRPKNDEDFLPL